jgi:nitroreductase
MAMIAFEFLERTIFMKRRFTSRMTDFFAVLKARKSCRTYLPRPVENEKLMTIAETAYESPRALGFVTIVIVTNPALLTEMNDKTLIAMNSSGDDFLIGHASIPGYRPLYGGPAILIFAGRANDCYGAATTTASAATSSFAATALGLGSVYTITPTMVINNDPDLKKRLGLSEGMITHVGLVVGYEDPSTTPVDARANTFDIRSIQ